MTVQQLTARYFRLRRELSVVYGQQPWQSARIDRLAQELTGTERRISTLQAMDDTVHDRMPIVALHSVQGAVA